MNDSISNTTTFVSKNYVMLLVDWPFFMFHLSLCFFIFAKIFKKDGDYNGGFYVIYLIIAIGDSISFIQLFICYRLPQNGFFVEFIVISPFSNDLAKYAYAASAYIAYYDAMAHMIISFNRFTAVFFHTTHTNIWKGRYLFIILTVWLLIPLGFISFMFPKTAKTFLNENGSIGFFFDDSSVQITHMILRVIVSVTSSIVSCLLEIFTAIKYKKIMNATTFQQRNQYRNDIRLYSNQVYFYHKTFSKNESNLNKATNSLKAKNFFKSWSY